MEQPIKGMAQSWQHLLQPQDACAAISDVYSVLRDEGVVGMSVSSGMISVHVYMVQRSLNDGNGPTLREARQWVALTKLLLERGGHLEESLWEAFVESYSAHHQMNDFLLQESGQYIAAVYLQSELRPACKFLPHANAIYVYPISEESALKTQAPMATTITCVPHSLIAPNSWPFRIQAENLASEPVLSGLLRDMSISATCLMQLFCAEVSSSLQRVTKGF